MSIEEFDIRLEAELDQLAKSLSGREYLPFALREVPIPKGEFGWRTLAFPTVRDRVAQSLFLQRHQPAFDAAFEDCSFAYRRGRSVADALHAVREWWDRGYRWVVDADIDSFFDAIPLHRLFDRLLPVVPDPDQRRLLALWITCPRWDGKDLYSPACGIPQGVVVSPSLANLFLDEFDERLVAAGCRLVRHADDFLILSRSERSARESLELTEEVLDSLGLTLNPDKTEITTFDRGFKFLGAMFVRSLIARPLEKRPEAVRIHPEANLRPLPPEGWQSWLRDHEDDWRRHVARLVSGES